MRCQYCGREAQPGQVYCECGHPVSLSGASSDPYAQGFQQPQGFGNMYTPDGRNLASLQKQGMGAGGKIAIMLIVILLVAAGGFLAFKLLTGGDILDESNWKKFEKSEFSITLPKSFEENNNVVHINSNSSKLAFYKGKQAGVYISKGEFTSQQKSAIQTYGLDAIKDSFIRVGNTRKVNGYQVTIKERGDMLYMEYPLTRSGYISGDDKLWIIDATLITKDRMYEIEAYCAESEKDKYSDVMFKWIDSFKVK